MQMMSFAWNYKIIVIRVDCRNVLAKRIDKNSRSENSVLDTRPGNGACYGDVRNRQTNRQKTKTYKQLKKNAASSPIFNDH